MTGAKAIGQHIIDPDWLCRHCPAVRSMHVASWQASPVKPECTHIRITESET